MNGFFAEINRVLDHYLTPAVKKIFVINVVVTLASIIFGTLTAGRFSHMLETWFSLNPRDLLLMFNIFGLPIALVQCFTYMFVHLDVFHLLFNMFILWFFAPDLENRWGTRRFWRFYLTVGAGAGFLHLLVSLIMLFNFNTIKELGPLIGASGALYGVILAFAAYNPEAVIYIWGVLPLKAKYFAAIMGLMTFMSTASGQESQVSNLTHLLGLAVAYVYLGWYHRDWDIRRWQWR